MNNPTPYHSSDGGEPALYIAFFAIVLALAFILIATSASVTTQQYNAHLTATPVPSQPLHCVSQLMLVGKILVPQLICY